MWEPGLGEQVWTTDELARRMSGGALLVSPDPIDDPGVLLKPGGSWMAYAAICQMAFLAGLLLLGLIRRRGPAAFRPRPF